jgi:REP element-mobilizing transposase RayT
VIENLAFYRRRADFRLHAYVVMPDHLHLLITPQRCGLSDCMRNVKSLVAKSVRELLGRSGPIWQARFHDRGVRTMTEFQRYVAYIHMNPVVAGLCGRPQDYRFS